MCVSDEFSCKFSLPIIRCDTASLHHDLADILGVYRGMDTPDIFAWLHRITPVLTPTHLQWASNALLHLSWANRSASGAFDSIRCYAAERDWNRIPLNAMLNLLLVWCIVLGYPVEEEVLRIQDKSYATSCFHPPNHSLWLSVSDRLERILSQFSQAITSATDTSHPQSEYLPHVLRELTELENRPSHFTTMAYKWCSDICANCSNLAYREELLLLSLEIGFRHLDHRYQRIPAELSHSEHHQQIAEIVFESADDEVIADLLHAWTSESKSHGPHPSLSVCAKHVVFLQPTSERLRRLLIRSVYLIGYRGFKAVGVEQLVGLLDDLGARVEDIDNKGGWVLLLLDVVKSSEGIQRLSHQHWRLLGELTISCSWMLGANSWSSHVTTLLEGGQEWDKLECWMGVIWMLWPPKTGGAAEEDIERVMLLLFRRRPDAIRKLTQRIERRCEKNDYDIPESFQGICGRARSEAARWDTR